MMPERDRHEEEEELRRDSAEEYLPWDEGRHDPEWIDGADDAAIGA